MYPSLKYSCFISVLFPPLTIWEYFLHSSFELITYCLTSHSIEPIWRHVIASQGNIYITAVRPVLCSILFFHPRMVLIHILACHFLRIIIIGEIHWACITTTCKFIKWVYAVAKYIKSWMFFVWSFCFTLADVWL